jgi:hypothetical protein
MRPAKEGHGLFKYFWIVTLYLLVLGFPAHELYAQQPFTVEQIITLLDKKVAESDIKTQIEKYKVTFQLTTANTRSLIRAGASDGLLKIIEDNLYQEVSITSPKKDEEVGATLRIQGRSKKIPDKHLWVFVQRQGLSVWWPQGGEVKVDENGEWTQGAFVGRPEDVGFKFEIVATWVNAAVHKDLIDYLQTVERTGRYPGIRLPEGSPEARVTVRKTTP